MTEMVYGAAPLRTAEPILSRWWRTVDKWSLSCVLMLFGVGLLLGLAASPPLAERNGLEPFYYVQRQAFFVHQNLDCAQGIEILRPEHAPAV